MKCHDDEPSARLKGSFGAGEAFDKLTELIVDIHPEGLERSRSRPSS